MVKAKNEAVETKVEETKVQLSPAERRAQSIEAALGSTTGWKFVEHVTLEGTGRCEASGGRMKNGIKIQNKALGKEMVVGKGVATKYTDVKIPAKPRKSKAKDDAVVDTTAAENVDIAALESAILE